jgi:ribA/ribD-fused uncharacterized protein
MASFRGDRFFLSNFYPATITLHGDGVVLPTAEHAYVWYKTLDPAERALVEMARTPGDVKRLGRRLTLRPDWDEIKLKVMRGVVGAKFAQHEDLARKLIATLPDELVEENEWGDRFWGTCRGVGQNWLGKILMEIREDWRATGLVKGL